MSSSVLLFTKIPKLAKAKTRLKKSSGLDSSVIEKLADAFLADTLSAITKSNVKDLVVFTEPKLSKGEFLEYLEKLDLSTQRLQVLPQIKEDFWNRLDQAIEEAFGILETSLIILGSDSPNVSPDQINKAKEFLEKDQFVVGPSQEGGFYLLGIPKSALEKGFSLANISNGKEFTEIEQVASLIKAKDRVLKLIEMNFDIDIYDDINTLLPIIRIQKLFGEDYPKFTEAVLESDCCTNARGLRRRPLGSSQ